MRKSKGSGHTPATTARIARAIGLLRGQKVLLDFDLAVLYGVREKDANHPLSPHRRRNGSYL